MHMKTMLTVVGLASVLCWCGVPRWVADKLWRPAPPVVSAGNDEGIQEPSNSMADTPVAASLPRPTDHESRASRYVAPAAQLHAVVKTPEAERFGYLPADKQEAVTRILSRYETLIRSADAGEEALEEADRQALADFLHSQQDKRLTELLTPEEKFEYDLRESECAQQVRDLGMTLSDEEFRSVVWIQRWFDAEWSAHAAEPDFDDHGLTEARTRAMQEALGDRYLEYEQMSDPYWESYVEFTEVRGLDRGWAEWLRQCRSQYAKATTAIANEAGLDPEVRDRQLAELHAGFASGLQNSLGAHYSAALESVLFWMNSGSTPESHE